MAELAVREQPGTVEYTDRGGARTGRPTLYNETLGKAICDKIAVGMTKRGACGLLGVTEEVFQLWSTTRDGFITMLAQAEAEAEEALTKTLFAAGTNGETKGDYKASIEWLKRRRRADYGDTLDVRKIDAETLLALLRGQADAEPQPLALDPGEDAL